MTSTFDSSYIIFFLIITIGGAIGGIVQSFRSDTSYLIQLPGKNEDWDTGIIGYIFSGSAGAIVLLTVIVMTTPFSFDKYINSNTSKSSEALEIPSEMFVTSHKKHEKSISQIIALIVENNSKIEKDENDKSTSTFAAWFTLLGLSVLGGFGGVSLISSAYKKLSDKIENMESVRKKDTALTNENKLETEAANVRIQELLKKANDSEARCLTYEAYRKSDAANYKDANLLMEQALELSRSPLILSRASVILSEEAVYLSKNNDIDDIRRNTIKKNLETGLVYIEEAIKQYDEASDKSLFHKIHWNQACNLYLLGKNIKLVEDALIAAYDFEPFMKNDLIEDADLKGIEIESMRGLILKLV